MILLFCLYATNLNFVSYEDFKIYLNIYILLGTFFWNTGWYFLWVLKVFDEPLGESDKERRVKIWACISKEGT